jgi:hypothetical protein
LASFFAGSNGRCAPANQREGRNVNGKIDMKKLGRISGQSAESKFFKSISNLTKQCAPVTFYSSRDMGGAHSFGERKWAERCNEIAP